jgi:hypothetical protein
MKEYVCECGKIFSTPNSFNGHKSTCKEHHLAKYGNLDVYTSRYKTSIKTLKETNAKKVCTLKTQRELKWISEKHTCEKCGKVMTEKFGSGRFCSRACANTREHTVNTISKIAKSVKKSADHISEQNIINYYKNPKLCEICSTPIQYEHRNRKTCSDKCRLKLIGSNIKDNPNGGGLRKGSGNGKHGSYKGYYCDSTYELVYVIYNIDHNIRFKRNHTYYNYTYNGKEKKYYPDFVLEDNSLVEIKGYYTDEVKAKLDSVKDRPIKILYKDDLKYAFDYVSNNYAYNSLTDLYDSK